MKTLILFLAIAASPALAQDANDGGLFINGSAGYSLAVPTSNSGNHTGFAVSGGYRAPLLPGFAIGPEVGYNYLGGVVHGYTAGISAHYNLTPGWYVSGRGGIYAWRGAGESRDPFPINHSATGYYGGAGFGYDVSRNFGLGLAYDYYHADTSDRNLSTHLFSVNAEYRF